MSTFPPVEAVVRALQVLEALNRQPVATLTFLHAETGIPKPSIIRLLQTPAPATSATPVSAVNTV